MDIVQPPVEDLTGRLQAISDFVAVISSARGHADVLRLVATASRQALGAAHVTLSQWDRQRGVLRIVASDPQDEAAHPGAPVGADAAVSLADCPALDRLLVDGVGNVASSRSHGLDPVRRRRLDQTGTTSSVAVPIVVDGGVWGELWAGRTDDQLEFATADLRFARTVADHAAAGVRQAERLDRVERLAYTDDLTGLANRRAFEDRLGLAVAEHQSHGGGLAVVVADVNGLKRINDGHGHQAGDAALVRFAASLTEITERVSGTHAARVGGDEFAVLCIGLTAEAAVDLATEVADRGAQVLPEGAACGLALAPDRSGGSLTPARILRAADTAQYRAKEAGSRAPVVVGSDGAVDVALPGAGGLDRRALRGEHRDHPTVLEALVAVVDGVQPATVPDRLEAVAAAATSAFDADGWQVCELGGEDGAPLVRAAGSAPGRATRRPSGQLSASGTAPDGVRWTVQLHGADRIRAHGTTLRAAVAIALQPHGGA